MADRVHNRYSSSSRHPLPPHVERYSRDRPTSSRHSPSASSTLPSYDDLVPTTSGYSRRTSENDGQAAFSKRKSLRTSSFRKKQNRARPKITIVSSQPMNDHPAFADGSKGSCVPPEAPPSYEEVIKESATDEYRSEATSSANNVSRPAVLTTVSTNVLPASASERTRSVEFCLDASGNNPSLPVPLTPRVLVPTSRSNNRNQNNSDIRATSPTALPANREARSSATSPNLPSSAACYFTEVSITTTTVATPRPPVPKKPGFLAKTSTSSTSPPTSSSTMNTHEGLTLPVSSSTDQSTTARKLPPPPRPATAPKRPPPIRTNKPTSAAVDKHSGCVNIKNKPIDISCTNPRNTNDKVNVQNEVDKVNKPCSVDNNKRIYEPKASQSESFFETPIRQNSGENTTKTDTEDTTKKTLTSSSGVKEEPTYAVVKKPSVTKRKIEEPPLDLTVEDGASLDDDDELTTPPPVPSTRPPIEDYEGLFDSPKPESLEAFADAAANIADLGIDLGKKIEDEDPYSKIDLRKAQNKSSNAPNPPSTGPIGSHDVAADPPYQTVFFKQEVKGKENMGSTSSALSHQHHPKANTLPPPLPPLPAAVTKSNSLNRPNPAPKPKNEAIARIESSTPKKKSSVRRKSMKLKQKILNKKSSYEELPSPQNSRDDLKNLNGRKASPAHHVTSAAAADINHVKKTKRPPPPRPALPAVLRNKLHSSDSPANVTLTDGVLITFNDAKVQQSNPLLSTTKQSKPPPPKHPPPPRLVTAGTAEKPTSLSSNATFNPVPRLRHKPDAFASENHSALTNEVTSPTKRGPPKPSRPPTNRPPLKSDSGEPMQNEKRKSSITSRNSLNSEDNKSILEIANENKDEDLKAPVDEAMKNYLSNETSCVVIQNYDPGHFTDLSLTAGEKILVLKQIDDTLCFGRKENGEEGPFPRQFVVSDPNSNNSNRARVTKPPVAKKRQRKPEPTLQLIGKAKALHDYASTSPDDLRFKAGSEIDIVDHIGRDWLRGRIGEKEGIFPRNFVSFTPSSQLGQEFGHPPKPLPFVIATHDFKSEFDNELSFNAGDKLTVISRVDDDWLNAKLNNRTGIVPLSFVDSSTLGAELDKRYKPKIIPRTANSSSNNNKLCSKTNRTSLKSRTTKTTTAVAQHDFLGENESELTLRKNDIVIITGQVDSEWLEGKLGERTGIFPSSFVSIT